MIASNKIHSPYKTCYVNHPSATARMNSIDCYRIWFVKTVNNRHVGNKYYVESVRANGMGFMLMAEGWVELKVRKSFSACCERL